MESRPDPDELLERIQEREARARRGRLKIVFGAAPGVGKTYAMLEAAQARKREGVDVVVGWVETHGRKETEALLEGLELLPPRLLSYRGKELREFDLDAALERHPPLILVDELAHTNAPGSRHAKRWRDVQELLAAGIDVITTLNVQHIESLNDVVAQITGVTVSERVPDSVFEGADEVEIVDLPADDLIQRLREGKVYFPGLAEQALGHFFRPGNLIALRELALRKTADRVDVQMQDYRKEHRVGGIWPAAERVMVCLGPSPYGQHLVRSARLLASRLKAEWIALYVETPAHRHLAPSDREQLERTLRLAEQLGGQVVSLSGPNAAEEILAFARARNVTKIVLGKPPRSLWPRIWRPSFVEELIRSSGGIDVHIIGGSPEERLARIRRTRGSPSRLRPYLWAMAVVTACALVSALFRPLAEPVNLAMIYLLGVALVAALFGAGPSVLASVVSVAIFDFFFVPPYLTFAVSDYQYGITFLVMLVVALLISNLTARVRSQAQRARAAHQRTQALFDLSQDLARAADPQAVAETAVRHLHEHYGAQSAVFLPVPEGGLALAAEVEASFASRKEETSVARWAYEHRQPAGVDTDTLPGSDALYLPLEASTGVVGVVGVRLRVDPSGAASEQRHLLEALVNQVALALERAVLAQRARQARMEAESERLRSTMLSAVSHDFRTPLASIMGASSAILTGSLSPAETGELARSIFDESKRLGGYVTNLLEMTRLESGAVSPTLEWQPLEEVVGAVLNRLKEGLRDRPLTVSLPADLPLVKIDAPLMEMVFYNLLDNVLKHTPPGTPVAVSGRAEGDAVVVEVADRGAGLPEEELSRIFDRFYRSQTLAGGSGLGLAICRAVVRAHGGTIVAAARPGGGTVFTFTIPLREPPPGLPPSGEDAGGAEKKEEP
jgi:two-component system sensor histidine kinase KdpD